MATKPEDGDRALSSMDSQVTAIGSLSDASSSRSVIENPERSLCEIEITAFEEVKDPWYLRRIEKIRDNPIKYKSWRQWVDPLVGPITGEEDT